LAASTVYREIHASQLAEPEDALVGARNGAFGANGTAALGDLEVELVP
jgi:hypothetical protein